MANSGFTVAIFGGTGNLGKHISRAFLANGARERFKDVIVFSRQSSLPSTFKEFGAVTTMQIPTDTSDLSKQLKGVDIVVNVIGSKGDELRTQVVQAMAESQVRVYFPSEFGVDHREHKFQHPEWDKKKAHFKLATELLPNTKICRVFAGLFLEDSIGPWFGFDTKNDKYTSYGSSNEKVAYTSMDDVGRAVVSLALIPPQQLPQEVHLAGSLVSMKEVASIMQQETGKDVNIEEQDMQKSKDTVLKSSTSDPAEYLRFLMGEGQINHGTNAMGNNNELVNPGEDRWKWKTISTLAAETRGRPWADSY